MIHPMLRRLATAVKQFHDSIIKQASCKAIHLSSREYSGLEHTHTVKSRALFAQEDIDVNICGDRLIFLRGTEIDYSSDAVGYTFTFKHPVVTNKNNYSDESSFNPRTDYI